VLALRATVGGGLRERLPKADDTEIMAARDPGSIGSAR